MRKGCLIAIIIIMGSFLGYLQYGRDMDVCSSLGISSDNYYEERLTVVTNKLYISDQKTCAEKIIERCKKNNFKSVRFSYDQSIPNALYVDVYSSSYLPEQGNGAYNIINDPDKYMLEIE